MRRANGSALCPDGRWIRRTYRLIRSTMVPMAERLCLPTIRSPSQSPILVRASTIGGRWWISNAGATKRGCVRWPSSTLTQRPAGAQLGGQRPAQPAFPPRYNAW